MTEIRRLVDKVTLVGEAEMLAAIGYLSEREGALAEPAGAAATAAFQQSVGDKGKQVALLVTGNNIAPDVREKALGAKN